jgi:hypothetical protein
MVIERDSQAASLGDALLHLKRFAKGKVKSHEVMH